MSAIDPNNDDRCTGISKYINKYAVIYGLFYKVSLAYKYVNLINIIYVYVSLAK